MGFVKKKKMPLFYRGLIIYVCSFVSLAVFGLVLLWDYISEYETSLPGNAAQKYLSQLQREEVTALFFDALKNKEDNLGEAAQRAEQITQAVYELGALRCTKRAGEQNSDVPVYTVIAGDTALWKIYFKINKDLKYGFSQWTADRCELLPDTLALFDDTPPEILDYTITVPYDAVVVIDGKTLDETDIKDARVEYGIFDDVKSYMKTVPYKVTYAFAGTDATPEISVKSADGTELPAVRDGSHFFCSPPASSALETEHTKKVIAFAKDYIYYVSQGHNNYKENCKKVLGHIIPGSVAAQTIDGSTYAVEWNNTFQISSYDTLEAKNFIRYADNCFYTELVYDVTMTRAGRVQNQSGTICLFYIEQAGEWKIAGLKLN